MRKYLILTGKLLKSGLGGFAASGKNKKKKRNLSQGVMWLILLVCLIPMIGMLYKAGGGAYGLLAPIGQEGVALELAFFAGSIMNLMLGFPMIISVFYMTGDIEKLLYLPLHPWQIVGAKFTVSLLYTYLTSLYFLCPFLVGYGIASGAGAIFWIFIVIAVILLPVMPLVYSAILSMIIMRVFKKAKNKDFLSIISVILSLVLAFGISSFTSSMGNMGNQQLMDMLMKGRNSLMGLMNGIFPSLRFLEKGVAEGSILSMLIFLGITALALVVFFLIAERLYFAGAMGMRETTARRKAVSSRESHKLNRRRSPRQAYLLKELRLLIRTPIYFMNCVMLVFLWPLFFLIPLVIQFSKSGGIDIGGLLSALDLGSTGASAVVLFVVLCVSLGAGLFNYVAGTAISREGKNFQFMKAIPVSFRTQLQAKLLSGLYIGVGGTTLYCLIILLVLMGCFGLPVWILPFALIGSVLANLIQCLIQLFMDLFHPKLTWESEQQAVKQNMNVMVGMLLNLIAGVGIGMLIFWLYKILSLPLTAYAAVVCVLLAAISFLLYKGVMAYGIRRIESLE
ncbi:hypothetical protein LQE92_05460 [Lacrimispora sp. NSJ-141]|uniref:ABC-2 type transport system permease protein n=1 Tax=Lientehia hominis TaxID=2897778 RepID=A0AAP2W9L9_9FIRM|nr:hypothetical protein [Lientehia hominis]MCD2492072.1 hypothetical protein [Lientehia hominis]